MNVLARGMRRLGEHIGVTSAVRTIAVSRTLTRRLRQFYSAKADRIHCVPNGADHILGRALAANAESTLTGLGLDRGRYLIAVGRLEPENGFSDLIRAHKKSGTTLPLVIVGGASNPDHDHELADLAHDGVILTGDLAQAKLFVMPSHHEDLPIAALEAWAMNAPLLLSDIQHNRGLGLPDRNYFPVGDIDTLARCLESKALMVPVVSLPEALTWTSIARATIEVYGEVSERILSDSETA